MNEELIYIIKRSIRVKTESAQDEIEELIGSCIADLKIAGVYVEDLSDPLFIQSVKLYCKAHYGFDDEKGRFKDAYSSLKDAMALCGDYAKKVI